MTVQTNSSHKVQYKDEELLVIARKVFDLERQALDLASDRIDESFLRAVHLLDECKGKVIISGLGKSGIAGQKIAATLSSTGVPALFLHAGEAGHGDLGVVSKGDLVLALSYSGETQELVELIPRFKVLGVPVISLTGNLTSALANASDVVLNATVPNYPWPYGLLPTASNAVTVAIGDALAVALLIYRGIKEEDFALYHPGGLLGRKKLAKVGDLMHTGDLLPIVKAETKMSAVLVEMTAKRLGVACVLEENRTLAGIITDGDLRRLFERNTNPLGLKAIEVMTRNPRHTNPDALAARALHEMESHSITVLPVLDESGLLAGILHLHDILKLETQS